MRHLSDFLDTIVLLGSLQGFILSTLLYYSRRPSPSGRILGKLLFLLSLASLNMYITSQPWFGSSRLWSDLEAVLPMILAMPFGPLVFFYIRSLTEPDFTWKRSDRVHFYPIVIDLIPNAVALLYLIGATTRLFPNNPEPVGIFIDRYNLYADIPRWVSLTTYLILAARSLSTRKTAQASWAREFIGVFLCFQLIWLVYLIPYVIPRYNGPLLRAVGWYPLFVPLAVLIYWLGIKSYLLLNSPSSHRPKRNPHLDKITLTLREAMEKDALYLNPHLNLTLLAQHTGLSSKTISAAVNQHLDKNFNDFINEYRVKAVKEKIQSEAYSNLTIAGIALQCGFNSPATFQRTFKQHTGLSPSAFRKTSLKS